LKIKNVIYILTNAQYPGYVKIGYASDLRQRLATLNTGAMADFVPYAVYETEKQNADLDLHRLIELLNPMLRASLSTNKKIKLKEYFKLDPGQVYELLSYIAELSGTRDRLHMITRDLEYSSDENITRSEPEDMAEDIKEAESIDVPDGSYYLTKRDTSTNLVIKAIMKVSCGEMFLLAGSEINSCESKNLPEGIRQIRKTLPMNSWIITEDLKVTNLTAATAAILGTNCKPETLWKDARGYTLKELQFKDLE